MPINIENPIQIIRGNKASISARTGKDGEPNWATDTHELYIHDGVTPGGHKVGGGGLDASSVDNTTISAEDGVLSVIPGGIVDNDSIVIDNDGKISVNSDGYKLSNTKLQVYSSSNVSTELYQIGSEAAQKIIPISVVSGVDTEISHFDEQKKSIIIDEDGIYSFKFALGVSSSADIDILFTIFLSGSSASSDSHRIGPTLRAADVISIAVTLPCVAGDEIFITNIFPDTAQITYYTFSAWIVKFPSLVDAPNSGEADILPFTPPTADAPGKEGLVPAPEIIDPSKESLKYLGVTGWRDFSNSTFGLSSNGKDELSLKLNSCAPNTNLNSVWGGIYVCSSWADVPTGFSVGGYTIVIETQNVLRDSGKYESGGLQIYIDVSGRSAIRYTLATFPTGETPITTYGDWNIFNAPKPQAAEGVGQWQGISVVAKSYTLPIRGVWAYYLNGLVSGQGVITEQFIGVKAGGALISARQPQTTAISGLVWRIA